MMGQAIFRSTLLYTSFILMFGQYVLFYTCVFLAKWRNIIATKWGPQTIAKLVYNSNVTMVYGTYNYSIHGVNLNHLTSLGGPTL